MDRISSLYTPAVPGGPPSSDGSAMFQRPGGELLGRAVQVLHLPHTWSEKTVKSLFESCGGVEQCRMFPVQAAACDWGLSAILAMESREAAEAAVCRFNNWQPQGSPVPLVVRLEDWQGPPAAAAAAEAASAAWGTLANLHSMATVSAGPLVRAPSLPTTIPMPVLSQARPMHDSVSSGSLASVGGGMQGPSSGAAPSAVSGYHVPPQHSQEQQQLFPAASSAGPDLRPRWPGQQPQLVGEGREEGGGQQGQQGQLGQWQPNRRLGGQESMPSVAPPAQPQQQGWSSVFIKGLPVNADKLWLYEKFARYGAVDSVRVLVDEATGLCNGVGYCNYCDGDAAARAAEALNGVRMGERLLHVMVQQQHHRRQPFHRQQAKQAEGGRGRGGGGGGGGGRAPPQAPPQAPQAPLRQQPQSLTWAQAAAMQAFILQQTQQPGWQPAGRHSPCDLSAGE